MYRWYIFLPELIVFWDQVVKKLKILGQLVSKRAIFDHSQQSCR